MTPLHLGPAHEVEQWLTLVLALGPFVALAVVIMFRRRQDEEDDEPGVERGVGDVGTAEGETPT